MSKHQEIKILYDIFVESINDLDSKLQLQMKKIKQEQNNLITIEKIKLLKQVCDCEGINFNAVKYKYLKQKEIDKVASHLSISDVSTIDDNIFAKIVLDDVIYYYEQKENGNVYNASSNIVGKFINNKILFDNS